MEPVDLQSLWICGALWIRGAQAPQSPGSTGAQAPWSTGSTEPRLHGAQAPRSNTGTGSTEPRMAAYHINGNTIHSMILANEHRSLGPMPLPSSLYGVVLNFFTCVSLHNSEISLLSKFLP